MRLHARTHARTQQQQQQQQHQQQQAKQHITVNTKHNGPKITVVGNAVQHGFKVHVCVAWFKENASANAAQCGFTVYVYVVGSRITA
jgi:hypothetical protein